MIKNVFTIDTEDWFHANYEDELFENSAEVHSTVEQNTEIYLEHFAKHSIKSTFFILGFVAEQHPDLVRKIVAEGHEVASHGYAHRLVYKQTPDEFRSDIRRSKQLIEGITGIPILGYRAPSWSITEQSLWALSILEEEGFKYDSSIFPFANFLYGIQGAPRFPFPASIYNENAKHMVEIPPSTARIFGVNIPFSGGFYFRVLPYWMIHLFGDNLNREGNSGVFYLHPREIDPQQPRLKLQLRDSLIHYYGIKGCEKKLTRALGDFSFGTMAELLDDSEFGRSN